MSGAVVTSRAAAPFSRGAVLAIILIGFSAFLAMLYFIGSGDTGGDRSGRIAHASSNAIHGYAGLAELLDANGYTVDKTRGRDGLDTMDLLILTPTFDADPEDIGEILDRRQYLGPTIVILPKWVAMKPTAELIEEDAERMQDDWVSLLGTAVPYWTKDLPEPFALTTDTHAEEAGTTARWAGFDRAGELPTGYSLVAEPSPDHRALVIDSSGRILATSAEGADGTDYNADGHWVTFVVEPDLVNNYGLADPARAGLALELIADAAYGERRVSFDMSLVGLGGSANLLTLAFQPPFLAATLCLILALIIVGWRAFLRFGPSAVPERGATFGKAQLVKNGAGLIVRARRLRLLAQPYTALIERRLGRALGLAKPDPQSIDAALSIRLPNEEPYSSRAATLSNASRALDVLRAAQHLSDLADKTTGTSKP